jgi:ribosomal protein L37AE/L43A
MDMRLESGLKTILAEKGEFLMETQLHQPTCPKCGSKLEKRKFVDCWDADGTPEWNEDLYCAKCDIRWSEESGPHYFLENWKPEEHTKIEKQ